MEFDRLDTTFFTVELLAGKVRHIRIVDECYSSADADLQYEALRMTREQREEEGIYTARQIGIDYESVVDYNRCTGLVMDMCAEEEDKHTLSEIKKYWYDCANDYFHPMTRRLAAIVAWETIRE